MVRKSLLWIISLAAFAISGGILAGSVGRYNTIISIILVIMFMVSFTIIFIFYKVRVEPEEIEKEKKKKQC